MAYLSAKQCDLPSSTGDLISIKSGFLALGFLQNGEFIYLQVMRVSMLKMMIFTMGPIGISVLRRMQNFMGHKFQYPANYHKLGIILVVIFWES